jgi:hypothetical protein
MISDEEVESYATSFAAEIRTRFEDDVRAAAVGLAQSHSLDSQMVEHTLWQGIIEDLGSDCDPNVCYLHGEECVLDDVD